jgi:hypothetical protein
MMDIAPYRERLRILLILYYFSDKLENELDDRLVRVFYSEVKIQKVDFLIRYPSYLCHELLRLHEESGIPSKMEVSGLIESIFSSKEPQLRTDDMQRFFFGAYEELDDIIAFLKGIDFVDFRSRKDVSFRDVQKAYYITKLGASKIEMVLPSIEAAQWYIARCQLIKYYFGNQSGSDLKQRQYEIEVYKETPLGDYIADIEEKVKTKYFNLFGINL